MGPTAYCPCSRDRSFVVQAPRADFEQKSRMIIFDIDETILTSTHQLVGHSIFFGRGAQDNLTNDSSTRTTSSWSNSTVDGVWRYGFQLFYLKQIRMASLIRPNFLRVLDFLMSNEFNVVLYTRFCTISPLFALLISLTLTLIIDTERRETTRRW